MRTVSVMGGRIGAVALVAFAMVALAGPSVGGAAGGARRHALEVQLGEWNVVPSQGLVAAGPLRLTVENAGLLPHELDIIPAAAWGKKLPIRNGHALGRAAAASLLVDPGQTRSARVSLAPGFYILLDNIRGHYALGTEVPIVVA